MGTLLRFKFTLLEKPRSPVVLIAGGADADRDETIEDDVEVGIFKRAEELVWVHEQRVEKSTNDMLFAVNFTIGAGVRWRLEISNGEGKTLYQSGSTTVFPIETVSYVL